MKNDINLESWIRARVFNALGADAVNGLSVQEIVDALIASKVDKILSKSIRLTARQREVARLIRDEALSNREIAERIGVTERAVKAHVGKICISLGVPGRIGILAILRLPLDSPLRQMKSMLRGV